MNLIRGPFDIMNIANMMGLTAEQVLDASNIPFHCVFIFYIVSYQARQAISSNAEFVLRHGESRRNKYLPIRVISQLSYEESCRLLAQGMRQDNTTATNKLSSKNKKKRKTESVATQMKRARAAYEHSDDSASDIDKNSQNDDDITQEYNEDAEDDGFLRL
jgi:hypothetical protein